MTVAFRCKQRSTQPGCFYANCSADYYSIIHWIRSVYKLHTVLYSQSRVSELTRMFGRQCVAVNEKLRRVEEISATRHGRGSWQSHGLMNILYILGSRCTTLWKTRTVEISG